MKTFAEYITENSTLKSLDRTFKSIQSFKQRNPGHSMNNQRALKLMDRYDDLKDRLSDKEWEAYCKSRGFDPYHKGVDVFA